MPPGILLKHRVYCLRPHNLARSGSLLEAGVFAYMRKHCSKKMPLQLRALHRKPSAILHVLCGSSHSHHAFCLRRNKALALG